MKQVSLVIISLCLLLGLTTGCKKKCYDPTDTECENYDPCYGRKTATTAGFAAYQPGGYLDAYPQYRTYSDTLFAEAGPGYWAGFIAADSTPGTTYKWKVGTDTRTWTTKRMGLSFGEDVLHQSLPVTLITSRPADAACMQKTSDTITKSFYFVSPQESQVWGKYRGYLAENPTETFDIEVYKDSDNVYTYFYNPTNRGCHVRIEDIVGLGYKELFAETTFSYGTTTYSWDCPNLPESEFYYVVYRDLHFKVNPSGDSIRIHFTELSYPSLDAIPREIKHEFIGVRIP